MDDLCITCNFPVLESDIGVECDLCHRWNHVICKLVKPQKHLRKKKITIASYKKAVKEHRDIPFTCNECEMLNHEMEVDGKYTRVLFIKNP